MANAQSIQPMNWLEGNGQTEPVLIHENPAQNQGQLIEVFRALNDGSCGEEPIQTPTNLDSEPKFSGRLLKWDPVPGSIACEIQAGAIDGNMYRLVMHGFEISERYVSTNYLEAGLSYQWRIRCACQIQPEIIVSDFSDWDYFTMPLEDDSSNLELPPSDSELSPTMLYPNPAQSRITIYCAKEPSSNAFGELFDLSGKPLGAIQIKKGENQFSIENLEDGVYVFKTFGIENNSTFVFVKVN